MLAAAAITLLSFSGAQAAAAPAPLRVQNLDQVIRCAGLTQAASELEGGESGDGRALYDAALFWSLTAIQAGQAARHAPAATETRVTRARIAAVRELTIGDAAARTQLQRCRERTPSLG
jgi:hypothetical protein